MRPFFHDGAYIGCDMRPGPGVDCLTDAHRLPFRDGSVGTVLLLDTLEHVQNPALAVEEASRVVRRGGIVLLASVMNFPIHSYPADYWRFTPAAFDYLLSVLNSRMVFSQGDGEFPHTVIGIGSTAAGVGEEGEAFRAAVRGIQNRWDELMYGGPLIPWQPVVLALAQRVAERRLPELEQGRSIAQSFVCPSNELSRIDVKMSNFARPNSCHVVFRLRQEDGQQEEIAVHRLLSSHMIDGGWAVIPIPGQVDSAGRRYLLTLESPDATPGQAVTAMASNDTVYQEGQLSINGQPAEGSLCFQVYCRSPDKAASMSRLEPLSGVNVRGRRASTAAPPDQPNANEIAALTLRAEEQRWEQVRYLSAVIRSGFDGIHADLKAAEARLEALERIQRQTLEQSTDAAALTRAMRRNPLFRIWRRIFR